MQYEYKPAIEILSNNFPTCDIVFPKIRQGLGRSREGYIQETSYYHKYL